ncbi:MAG: glutathione S-transferase [Rhodobacteraceae bacterium]|nr:glutathione S-transferase [Paracoccaceae bacterium]
MRLYHAPASPYVRKVMIVLLETGQAGDVALVPATGTPLDPATMPVAHNPLGKVPTLERDDGPALYDSRVICRYLDDRAGAGLYPPAPRLWEVLTLEATGDGITDAALLMVYESRVRTEEMRSPAWVEGQWAKIARTLDALEGRWMAHLAGPLDAGQIAVAAALGYLDFRLGGRDWRAGRPALSAWFARFSERESLRATLPTG